MPAKGSSENTNSSIFFTKLNHEDYKMKVVGAIFCYFAFSFNARFSAYALEPKTKLKHASNFVWGTCLKYFACFSIAIFAFSEWS